MTSLVDHAHDLFCQRSTDSVIQRTKWHFNHMSSPQMKSGLEKIQEELEFQPPAVLSLEGTDVTNGMLNGHTPVCSEPAPNLRMEPVTHWVSSPSSSTSCVLPGTSSVGVQTLFTSDPFTRFIYVFIFILVLERIRPYECFSKSFYPGASPFSDGKVAQEEAGNILAFFIPSVACMVQCYLYLFYSPARTLKVVLMLAFICLGNVYLHGLRNTWQILFHIGVAFLSSYQILTRQLQERQSDYGV
ncbi:hypothetical protein STEG23_005666 [Scotinomys teguina]